MPRYAELLVALPGDWKVGTTFCGALVLSSASVPDDFKVLSIDPTKQISFYAVIPLYQDELDLKLRLRFHELLDRLKKHAITDLIDLKRRQVAKKKFGIV